MIAILSAVFAAALLAPAIQRRFPRWTGWLLALVPAAACGRLLAGGGAEPAHLRWAPSLGLEVALHADGLSRLFALLITGIGTLIVIYAGAYLGGHPRLGRMHAYLLLFMGSMLGIAFADNLLGLFLFWELTSISSFLLIGFEQERASARAAALQALLVTAGGGLALLAGFLLLGNAAGTYTISELAGARAPIVASPSYVPALLLILVGAFTKSAQVPFHFWLPNAMEAPTPVSAYLHSSTMVKAGVFLLARLHPAIGGTLPWVGIVTAVGGITAVTAAVLAYRQIELKRALAYSTVSALGLITVLLGIGGEVALRAALLVLLAHAMYKGALFLAAGSVAHAAGARDVTQLGGLGRTMPMTAVAAGAAALSMAGVPPLGGFVAKELMLEAVIGREGLVWLVAAAVVLAGTVLTAVAITVGVRPFIGPRPAPLAHAHEGPVALWLGALVLAIGGAAVGLLPRVAAAPLVDSAARAIGAGTEFPALHLWHGLTPGLMVSAGSVTAGFALAWRWRAPSGRFRVAGPERAYDAALGALASVAVWQTRILQSGYLRHYLLATLAATVLLTAPVLLLGGVTPAAHLSPSIGLHEGVLLALILLATGAAVRSGSRLGAVAALGIVGYSVALLYVSFGAPDLAMTQFVIETLTVILFLLALRGVPSSEFRRADARRWRDALVALMVGGVMGTLVLGSTAAVHSEPVSTFFVERSLPDAHGRNVVNVILVDFRALDTLGEITVLALAGTGVYALMRMRVNPGGVPR